MQKPTLSQSNLLLRQLLRYGCLLQLLIPLFQTLFHSLDAISLHVACTHQDTLQSSQAKVIV